MSVTLESLAPCFQGLIPATLYTCSLDGIAQRRLPQSRRLRGQHARRAVVPVLQQEPPQHRREPARAGARDRSRHLAGLGAAAAARAIGDLRAGVRAHGAAHRGDRVVHRPEGHLQAARRRHLRGAARSSRRPTMWRGRSRGRRRRAAAPSADPRFTMRALQDLAARINQAEGLDDLLDSILAGLDDLFGFHHSMILRAGRGAGRAGDDREPRLSGERRRRRGPLRRRHHRRGRRGAEADSHLRACCAPCSTRTRWRSGRGETGLCPPERIPLPGLANPESQLGVPLLVRGELVGVLCIESEDPVSLPRGGQDVDRAARQLPGDRHPERAAAGARRGRADESAAALAAAPPVAPPPAPAQPRREVTYYAGDELIMVDGEYLIRSLPARILWKLLKAHQDERPQRVHQSRAAARQVAEPAGVEGQPREPPAAVAAPARAEVAGHPPDAARARPLRAGAGLRGDAEHAALTTARARR